MLLEKELKEAKKMIKATGETQKVSLDFVSIYIEPAVVFLHLKQGALEAKKRLKYCFSNLKIPSLLSLLLVVKYESRGRQTFCYHTSFRTRRYSSVAGRRRSS